MESPKPLFDCSMAVCQSPPIVAWGVERFFYAVDLVTGNLMYFHEDCSGDIVSIDFGLGPLNQKVCLIAVEAKAILIYTVTEPYHQLCSVAVPKKVARAKFVPNSTSVVVGDRSGDLYLVDIAEPTSCVHIGGHLACITCMDISEQWLLTGDRDERVRVSRSEKSSISRITGFALGHTEFITLVRLLSERPHMAITGAADGHLMLWDLQVGLNDNDTEGCSLLAASPHFPNCPFGVQDRFVNPETHSLFCLFAERRSVQIMQLKQANSQWTFNHMMEIQLPEIPVSCASAMLSASCVVKSSDPADEKAFLWVDCKGHFRCPIGMSSLKPLECNLPWMETQKDMGKIRQQFSWKHTRLPDTLSAEDRRERIKKSRRLTTK